MAKISANIPSSEILQQLQETLAGAFLEMRESKMLRQFLHDLLTPGEFVILGKRLMVAVLLQRGYAPSSICATLKMSKSTVHEVQRVLWRGGAGYAAAFEILEKKPSVKFAKALQNWFDALNLPAKGSKKDMVRWRKAMNRLSSGTWV